MAKQASFSKSSPLRGARRGVWRERCVKKQKAPGFEGGARRWRLPVGTQRQLGAQREQRHDCLDGAGVDNGVDLVVCEAGRRRKQ